MHDVSSSVPQDRALWDTFGQTKCNQERQTKQLIDMIEASLCKQENLVINFR